MGQTRQSVAKGVMLILAGVAAGCGPIQEVRKQLDDLAAVRKELGEIRPLLDQTTMQIKAMEAKLATASDAANTNVESQAEFQRELEGLKTTAGSLTERLDDLKQREQSLEKAFERPR